MSRYREPVRRRLLERDGAACRFCRIRVYPDAPEIHPQRLTFDHLWPDSQNGSDGIHNLVVACRTCNRCKRSAEPTGEWAPLAPPAKPPEFIPWEEHHRPTRLRKIDGPRIIVPNYDRLRMRTISESGLYQYDDEFFYRLRMHMVGPCSLV